MRLIDADALPLSWQPDCNGNETFVTKRDLDDATTVCCEDCLYYVEEFDGGISRRDICAPCYCGNLFIRRENNE